MPLRFRGARLQVPSLLTVAVSLIVKEPSVTVTASTEPAGTLAVLPWMRTALSSLADRLPSPIGSVTSTAGVARSTLMLFEAVAMLPAVSVPEMLTVYAPPSTRDTSAPELGVAAPRSTLQLPDESVRTVYVAPLIETSTVAPEPRSLLPEITGVVSFVVAADV